jgi:hemolysin activation/secretion protein
MNTKKYLCLILTATLVLSSTGGYTQEARRMSAGAVQTRDKDTMNYYRMEKKLDKEQAREKSPEECLKPTVSETAAPAIKVKVDKIIVTPSKLLTQKEIEGVINNYQGKELTIQDLFTAVNDINTLYSDKGYVTARAMLPPQKITNGVVTIKLIEGVVGNIEVKGNNSTRRQYILDRLNIKKGEAVNVKCLEKSLVFFNSTNDIQVRAEFQPGATEGTTNCILSIDEPDHYQITSFTDNAGRKENGLYRIGTYLYDSSLVGCRDHLTAGGVWADGTLAGNISYNSPIGYWGTRLGISYDINQVNVNSGPFEILDISGNSYDFGVMASQPVIAQQRLRSNLFAGFDLKRSSTEFSGTELFVTNTRTVTYGFDLQEYDCYGAWFGRNSFVNGFKGLGGDTNFFRYAGDLLRSQSLPWGLSATARCGGQLTPDHMLPSSEQFQIGGQSTVRGYTEGLLIGDNGYIASAELNTPIPFTQKTILKDTKAFIFVDQGGAFPYRPGEDKKILNTDFLTSVGWGININLIKQHVTGKINFGIPLTNRENTQGEVVCQFNIQVSWL